MTNKEKIINKIKEFNYKLGCYNEEIEKLSITSLNNLLNKLTGDSEDILVRVNRKPYVIEINVVDDEMDLNMIAKKDYNKLYKL